MLAQIALTLALASEPKKDNACEGICQDRQAITGWWRRDEPERSKRVCGCVYEQEANIPRKEKKGLTPRPIRTFNAQDYYTPSPALSDDF